MTRTPEASRRQVFAERFTLLYAEAGNPPLKRVANTVTRTDRVDQRGQPVHLSVQRLSDWRRGQAVPARFDALEIVLRTLIGMARTQRPYPIADSLYDLAAWRRLWQEALAAPVPAAGSGETHAASDPTTPAVDTGVCPYRGLAEFREQDAGHFFGRASSTAALLARVQAARATGGIVVLVGASGAGKSSLLRAGLLPALTSAPRGADTGGATAGPRVLVSSPGADPFARLRSLIPGLPDAGEFDDDTGPAGLGERLGAALAAGGAGQVVLVVDQFEELFTLCEEERRRAAFVRMLHQLARPAGPGRPPPAAVVLGVRADFYDQLLGYPELAEAVQERQMVLGQMSATELREAVTGPAKAVGLRLETGLVELLIRDLGVRTDRSRGHGDQLADTAGALPLLSHALLATWQRRQGGRLSIAGYRAAGGIGGAVEATAERAWAALDPAEQAAGFAVLLQLTRIGKDSQDTRRRLDKHTLLEQAGDPAAAAETALETLARARLITLDAGQVQITHEALLYAWPRLHGWIARNREALLVRQRLEEDADSWRAQDGDPSMLYRGARLEAVEGLICTGGLARPSELATAFLSASTSYRRRRTWTLRAGVATVLVLAIVASAAAVMARIQRNDAVFTEVLAEAGRLQLSDPSLAAQLDLVAHRMRPDDREVAGQVLSTQLAPLARPLPGGTGAIYDNAFSPDGRTLATAGEDHTVQLWNLTDHDHPTPLGRPLVAGTSWCSAARFSPNGRVLASANGDGTVHLWNVTDPARPTPLGGPLNGGDRSISLLTFSPDGRTLATANDDKTTRLWDLTDPAHPVLGPALAGHTDVVRSVAFSPDGHTLAAGSDDQTALLWDLTDPRRPVRLPTALAGHNSIVHSVAFSPDGHTLATGSDDKTARLWNITDPARPTQLGAPLTGHEAAIWSVAFSPDGQRLVTGSQDGTAKVWNITDLRHAQQFGQNLSSSNSGVLAVAVSPDGRTVTTGGQDGTTLLWSLPSTLLLGDTARLNTMALSPDGHFLASGGHDESTRLWNITDPAAPHLLSVARVEGSGYVGSLTFTPDGRLLAVSTGDGAARLWNLADPTHPVLAGPPLAGHGQYATVVAVTPDGRTLATAANDDAAQLWNITDPARPTPVGTPLPVGQGFLSSLAFSPDGHTLAASTANSSGTVTLWNVTNPQRVVPLGPPLQRHAGRIEQATFSPDGRLLAAADGHKTVLLWDLADPTRPAPLPTLTGPAEAVTTVVFSADSHTLAAGGADHSVRLWDVSDPTRPTTGIGPLSGQTGTVRATGFTPDGHTLASASEDNTVMLWNLDLDTATRRICTDAHGGLTPEQWRLTLPDLPYDPPC